MVAWREFEALQAVEIWFLLAILLIFSNMSGFHISLFDFMHMLGRQKTSKIDPLFHQHIGSYLHF